MEPEQTPRGQSPEIIPHQLSIPIPPVLPGGCRAAFSPFATELLQIAEAPDYEPSRLVDKLKTKPALDFLYAQSARVAEGYSLEEHTLMVLRQYERYLAALSLPAGFSKAEMRIALALHDIGKPIPADKRDQHEETLKVIDSLRDDLPISDQSWPLFLTLIGGDPLGTMLQGIYPATPREARRAIGLRVYMGESLELEDLRQFVAHVDLSVTDPVRDVAVSRAASDIKQRANLAGIAPEQFFELLLIYYRADTSAYTYDAQRSSSTRGFPGLEYLYSLSPDFKSADGSNLFQAGSGGLIFAPGVGETVSALRSAVKTASNSVALSGHRRLNRYRSCIFCWVDN